jgi:HD-like signal output (HDOD) protein
MQPHLHELPPQAGKIVAEAGIPPCPGVIAKLVREARSDDPDLPRIAELVSSDPALAAEMLKTANSALYGASAPLSSVRAALMRIGMQNAAQLITGLLLRQAFPVGGEQMETFWETSSRVAAFSAHIAGKLRVVERETAFTYGLFRDCGTAVMLQRFPDYPRLVAVAPKMGRRVTDLETVRYGATHAQLGFAMGRSWLLHEYLCLAVLHHHSPDAQLGRRGDLDKLSMRLIAVGALAEHAHLRDAGETPGEEHARALELSLAQFNITEAQLDEIALEAAEATAAA